MKAYTIIPVVIVSASFCFFFSNNALAEVWIPDNEFSGYYDANGVYTVIGAVKNTENYTIVPEITININDSGKEISESYTLSAIDSAKDLPFKVVIPSIESKNAVLEKPKVTFIQTNHNSPNIQVIYDKTLVKHPDGHTSGFIVNNGTTTYHDVRVYAVIYGKDGKMLDVGKSVENIVGMKPGEKVAFSMYPDPQHASYVSYYSCFAIGEDPTQTTWVERNGGRFYFTYLTSGAVAYPKFDDFKQTLSVTVRQPFPEQGFVNFMFPQESDDQKFAVMLDNKPIEFLQSKDPDGNWHVALNLPPRSVSQLEISGFESHSLLPVGNYRMYLLIIIPIAAAGISIIIWKKKKD
jgi:hypothetical protein